MKEVICFLNNEIIHTFNLNFLSEVKIDNNQLEVIYLNDHYEMKIVYCDNIEIV